MTQTNTIKAKAVLLGTSCLMTAAMFAPAVAGNLPSGGKVVSGQATITSSGKTTTIDQTSNKAIITWQDFSIGKGSTVDFDQPGKNAIALNRVLGSTPSNINGDLFANGHVWLINGNGVLFGKGAQVNVGSLIATTADMSDQNFLAGNYKFSSPSGNTNAGIVNNGSIRSNGGSIVLAGPVVSNNGIIQADLGNVTLGGVSTFSVDFQGDNLLRFAVTAPVQKAPVDAKGKPVKALVSNSGTISAKGGTVMMTARAAESVADNVINNSGVVEATAVSVKNGEVVLDAGDGTVDDSGTVDVSGKGAGETGGSVTVEAKTIAVADSAKLDASGDKGGGQILIGGDAHGAGTVAHATTTTIGHATITADATGKGNGGKIVVWSDGQTTFSGNVSARGGEAGGNGGFIETSGHYLALDKSAKVQTLAPKGQTGTWLLDPENIVVRKNGTATLNGGTLGLGTDPNGTDIIDPSTITNALSTTNVTLEASNDITVLDDILYSSTHDLDMLAGHNVDVLASIQNSLAKGGGAINLIAGWDEKTLPGSPLTVKGVYGNNGGAVTIGGANAANVAVGSASGTVTVAGATVTIDGEAGYSQLGYRGAGGGTIDVVSSGDLDLISNGGQAQIGNGALDGSIDGDITGNISINAGDVLNMQDMTDNGVQNVWIGNVADSSSIESGNIVFEGGFADNAFEGSEGFAAMVAADLGSSSQPNSGGDVLIALPRDALDLRNKIAYDSPHDLTLLTVGDATLEASVQNAGTGAVSLVSGWNGHSLSLQTILSSGAYGAADTSTTLSSTEDSGDVAFGSAGGTTTVAGNAITLDNANGYAQIGYHGAGGGDIDILAKGDLALDGGSTTASYALIGNGSLGGDVTGDVTGNISATVKGDTAFAYGGDGGAGGLVWLGNKTGSGGAASGNVSLTTGQATSSGTDANGADPGSLGQIIAGDMGTSATTGGDFTLALTNPQTDSLSAALGNSSVAYFSPHDLTILSTGNWTVTNSIQNAGAGALTLLAGWDSSVAPADTLTAGAYGNGHYVEVIGQNGSVADENPNSSGSFTANSGGGVAVGSKQGVTTVGGAAVIVESEAGYAQIGYHRDGGTGSINVIANGTSSDKNNGVEVTSIATSTRQPAYAQIGNLGVGVTGFSTAAINVQSATDVSVSGAAAATNYAMIGSGDASQTASQAVKGDIAVQANNAITVASGSWIGNRTGASGTTSGNVTLMAAGIMDGTGDGSILGSMLGADLGGGDVLVEDTGTDGLTVGFGYTGSSAHTLSLLSAGDLTVTGTLANSGSGDINLIAGWDGTTVDPTHFADAGVFGNNNATLTIGGSNASGNTFVGTRGGTSTAEGFDVAVLGENGGAQLGYHGSGGGDINVSAISDLVLDATQSDSSLVSFAQIGNGSSSRVSSGDITINSGSLVAEADAGTYVHVGNGAYAATDPGAFAVSSGASSGDITITLNPDSPSEGAGFMSLISDNQAVVQIGNAGNGSVSGDISITGTQLMAVAGSGGVAQIGNGGELSFGDASGDISVSMSSNGDTIGAILLNIDADDALAMIGNGGALANNNTTAGFSDTGTISLTAPEINLAAVGNNSAAIVGNGIFGQSASGTIDGNIQFGGDITLNALEFLFMSARGSNAASIVGNGAVSSLNSAKINGQITAGGDITVNVGTDTQGGEFTSEAGTPNGPGLIQIGNGLVFSLYQADISGGAAQASGDINFDVLGGGTHNGDADFYSDPFAPNYIGNGGYLSGPVSASGNISVTVDGTLVAQADSLSSPVMIANHATEDGTGITSTEAGNVTISAYDAFDLDQSIQNAIGGGDVTVELLDPNFEYDLSAGANYTSSHTLTLLSAGSFDVDSTLQNDGNGDINIVAGWDGTTVDPAQFGTSGVYGNNGGNVTIGGGNGSVSLGSLGTTTVSGDTVTIAAQSGSATLGYSGTKTGGGDIDVFARGNVDIVAGDSDSTSSGSSVAIGNDGGTGNISVNAGGNVNISAVSSGDTSSSFADLLIGNDGSGAVSGNIGITAAGNITIAASGGRNSILIGNQGNGSQQNDTVAGDIDLTAQTGKISISATQGDTSGFSFVDIGNVSGADVSGDVNLSATGGIDLSNTNSVLFIGSEGEQIDGSPATGNASGNISLNTAGALTISANDDANFFIGDAAFGNASGSISISAGTLQIAAPSDEGFALIGSNAAGQASGDINIQVAGTTTVSGGDDGSLYIGTLGGKGQSGNVTFVTGDLNDETASGDFLQTLVSGNIPTGDVTLGLTDPNAHANLGESFDYDSSHTLNVLSAGDLSFSSSLENDGTGAINLVAGWDGSTLDPTQFGSAGVFGNGGHGITIGGDGTQSGVMVGSKGGTTSAYGDFLTLSANTGFAQLGYNGAGQGGIVVDTLGDVTLNGGASDDAYAQIGNGGRGTNGSESGDIAITAGGDVTLNGGKGSESYAEIGHGGAESNAESEGYSFTGSISITADNAVLSAGSGNAAYTQIGHGGFKAGNGLTGDSEIGGDISVTVNNQVTLTGNGNDAYAQIGHGGDQLNINAGSGATGAISGNITVQASQNTDNTVSATAGSGANAYVQIGNGGYSINVGQANAANFTIGGNIAVADLALTGDGKNSYAQIGNGDNSGTGFGDVSGDITLTNASGETVTLTNGANPNSDANIQNAIGQGSVSGTVTGFQSGGDITSAPATVGTIVSLTNGPPPPPPPTDTLPEVILTSETPAPTTTTTSSAASPIAQMTGGDTDVKPSDQAAASVGNSLNGGKRPAATILLGGILRQQATGGEAVKPHAMPKADEDYSSWGNEALWQ
ncbi:MAG TPA: filamentous hemagglutinin N-terminal domain-containing protein [Rhizomicrobium sp.]|jgi:filamentous hemagglutinin family protein